MNNATFFDEQIEQSVVKSTIISKYFDAWAKVIIPTVKRSRYQDKRIAYIDLFAGPGRYKDGAKSTPILILEKALSNSDMQQMLITIFNDKDEKNMASLQTEIDNIPDINKLKNKPKVYNHEVGENILKQFVNMKSIPTLLFIDPWGYKGLSLGLIHSALQNWGCDCVFFFNYNRINMGLGNSFVREHMNALLGDKRADKLRSELQELNPIDRELAIVEELSSALSVDYGYEYVLPFRFKGASGKRTSHHLIFVSKSFKGYEIMKEIMAKESSEANQGVSSFEYNPAMEKQPLLFSLSRPIDDLANMLLSDFAGQTISMIGIYQKHNVGHNYIKRNYKEVLKQLEAEDKIIAEPNATKRKRNTFGDDVMVTFPA